MISLFPLFCFAFAAVAQDKPAAPVANKPVDPAQNKPAAAPAPAAAAQNQPAPAASAQAAFPSTHPATQVTPPKPVAAQPAAGYAPGIQVRLYELEQPVSAVPELVPGQLPNIVKVLPTLDMSTDAGRTRPATAAASQPAAAPAPSDFGGLDTNFLTEAVGSFWIQLPGWHSFRLTSDDGSKLWIDGTLVVDNDGSHGPEAKAGKVELAVGPHELRVVHFQGGGGAELRLEFQPLDCGTPVAYALLTPGDLSHKTKPEIATAPGKKKVIPALRRGRPGDGTPVTGTHPAFRPVESSDDMIYQQERWIADGRFRSVVAGKLEAGTKPPLAWLPENGGEDYSDFATGVFVKGPFTKQVRAYSKGENKRVFLDDVAGQKQGCVFRFGPARPLIELRGQNVLEMLAVRAMKNGLEIEFTKPLDPRCGWEPESYYIEQWPFDVAAGQSPHRDGIVYSVKSASVSADRKKVFLEVENLKPGHVVYLRLLPPCVAEDGVLPWSTEAWYTLHVLPQDRTGQVLPRPQPAPQNVLSEQEQKGGWRLLFDGQSPKGWHGFGKKPFPAGWQIKDGCLHFAADRKLAGGDIVTDDEFGDFELSLEWRVTNASNSGIMYRVSEDFDAPWRTGPE